MMKKTIQLVDQEVEKEVGKDIEDQEEIVKVLADTVGVLVGIVLEKEVVVAVQNIE